MLKKLTAIMLGAIVAAGVMDTSAFAFTAQSSAPKAAPQSTLYQDAEVNFSLGFGSGYNGFDGYDGYDRGRYGDRYRYRRSGYDYYHQGYYYNNPFWLVPGITIGSGFNHRRRGFSSHANYCASRYRSYDARTDTWISNSGQRRRCISN